MQVDEVLAWDNEPCNSRRDIEGDAADDMSMNSEPTETSPTVVNCNEHGNEPWVKALDRIACVLHRVEAKLDHWQQCDRGNYHHPRSRDAKGL